MRRGKTRTLDAMPAPAPLDLRVSDRVREWIAEAAPRYGYKDPVLCLSLWKADRWMLRFVDRTEIPNIEEITVPDGYRSFYLADGVELCFYEYFLLPKIEGKTLE